ncbi:hypothetical protein NEMIN01_0848 [Nematocida minor]|uniref:uncharacterized protein n=1 Tax=Nematocida minor TaxID=1912983 RepID=UPI00221FAB6D|nr:uncharacterized protein NEMIN01_0848 [Nematocida minor]KAI5190063.1 hypothetical protein NEMIN01_0848 [Nematocida minor]
MVAIRKQKKQRTRFVLAMYFLCSMFYRARHALCAEDNEDKNSVKRTPMKWLDNYMNKEVTWDNLKINPSGLLAELYKTSRNNIVTAVVSICFGPVNIRRTGDWGLATAELSTMIKRTCAGNAIDPRQTLLYKTIVNQNLHGVYNERSIILGLCDLFQLKNPNELCRIYKHLKHMHSPNNRDTIETYAHKQPHEILQCIYLHCVLYEMDFALERRVYGEGLNIFLYNIGREIDFLVENSCNRSNPYITIETYLSHIADFSNSESNIVQSHYRTINHFLNKRIYPYGLEYIIHKKKSFADDYMPIPEFFSKMYNLAPAAYLHPVFRFAIRNRLIIKLDPTWPKRTNRNNIASFNSWFISFEKNTDPNSVDIGGLALKDMCRETQARLNIFIVMKSPEAEAYVEEFKKCFAKDTIIYIIRDLNSDSIYRYGYLTRSDYKSIEIDNKIRSFKISANRAENSFAVYGMVSGSLLVLLYCLAARGRYNSLVISLATFFVSIVKTTVLSNMKKVDISIFNAFKVISLLFLVYGTLGLLELFLLPAGTLQHISTAKFLYVFLWVFIAVNLICSMHDRFIFSTKKAINRTKAFFTLFSLIASVLLILLMEGILFLNGKAGEQFVAHTKLPFFSLALYYIAVSYMNINVIAILKKPKKIVRILKKVEGVGDYDLFCHMLLTIFTGFTLLFALLFYGILLYLGSYDGIEKSSVSIFAFIQRLFAHKSVAN